MEKELVSIIIPAYNAEAYVERCLDSVLNQIYEAIEILVVDDGSKDRTGSICDAYAARDKRFRVFHIENGGVSRARNYGLKQALGTYVMFVDSDDHVAPDYVEQHYRAIRQTEADWAVTGYYICYQGRQEANLVEEAYTGVYERSGFGQAFPWLYRGYFLNSPWNKMYVRRLITSEFCVDMALGEDLRFNLDYLENVTSICISGACCYYYMCDEDKDSLTKRVSSGNFRSERENFHRVMEWCKRLQVADDTKIQHMYVKNMTAMLFSMARKPLPYQEKREIIKELCRDAESRAAMAAVKTQSWKSEVLRLLLARGMRRTLSLLLAVVRFL